MPRPIAEIAGKIRAGDYQVRLETVESTTVKTKNDPTTPCVRFESRVLSGGPMQGKKLSWLRFLPDNMIWKLGSDVMALGATEENMPAPPDDPPDKIAQWLANQYLNKVINVTVSDRKDESTGKTYTDVEVQSIAALTSDGFAQPAAAAATGAATASKPAVSSFDGV